MSGNTPKLPPVGVATVAIPAAQPVPQASDIPSAQPVQQASDSPVADQVATEVVGATIKTVDFSRMSVAELRQYADTVDEDAVIAWCVANKREKPLLPEIGMPISEARAAGINRVRYLRSLEVVELKISPNQHTPGKFYPIYCSGPNGRDEQWIIELKKWTKVPRYVLSVVENAVLMEPETDEQGDGSITVVTGFAESARFSYQVREPQDDNDEA